MPNDLFQVLHTTVFNATQILFVIVLSLLIVFLFSHKYNKLLYSACAIVFSFFISLQLLSLYITGKFIGINFYIYTKRYSLGNILLDYLVQITSIMIFFVILYYALSYCYERLQKALCYKKITYLVLMSFSLYYLCLPNGIVYRIDHLYKTKSAEAHSVNAESSIINGLNVVLERNKIVVLNTDGFEIESVPLNKTNEFWVGFTENMIKATKSYKIQPLKQTTKPQKGKYRYHLFVRYENGKLISYLGDTYATNLIKTGNSIIFDKDEIDYIRSGNNVIGNFLSPIKNKMIEKKMTIGYEPHLKNIPPNNKNICYSDGNWTISYNKNHLVYSMNEKIADKIFQDPNNVIFLHLHRNSGDFVWKDFRPVFYKGKNKVWTIRDADLKDIKSIRTGIWNTKEQKNKMFKVQFDVSKCHK